MEYLNINELVKMLNISKTTIYRLISKNKFPPPIKQEKFSYWKKEDITNWLNKL